MASPQPMRQDMLRKCVQNIERELFELSANLNRHTISDEKNTAGFKHVSATIHMRLSVALGAKQCDRIPSD